MNAADAELRAAVERALQGVGGYWGRMKKNPGAEEAVKEVVNGRQPIPSGWRQDKGKR